jgi:hypothetical protein
MARFFFVLALPFSLGGLKGEGLNRHVLTKSQFLRKIGQALKVEKMEDDEFAERQAVFTRDAGCAYTCVRICSG